MYNIRIFNHYSTTVLLIDRWFKGVNTLNYFRGKTSFWNGRTGTLTDAYQTHIADVLTIATNEEQSIVYSSGVDPNIMQFQPISTNSQWNHKNTFGNSNSDKRNLLNGSSNGAAQKRPKWVKTSHRSANTHDVRSIICVGKKVIMFSFSSHD